MFSEVFTKVQDGEIDFPVSTILDYLRLNEARAVDAGVFHVLPMRSATVEVEEGPSSCAIARR